MNSFKKDLEFGKKYELIFAKLTNQIYKQTTGLIPYDIELYYNNEIIKYEVKTDKRTYTTNNFAVEFESNEKPSGISISKADYWLFIEIINYNKSNDDNHNYEFNLYLISTSDLKDLIKFHDFKTLNVCENGKNKIYLINKKYLSKYYVNHKNNKNFFIYKKKETKNIDYSVEELDTMLNNL